MGHINMCDDIGVQKRRCIFENERIVTMAQSEKLNRTDLATYVTKMYLLFRSHIQKISKVKYV